MKKSVPVKSFDDYASLYPVKVRTLLIKLRRIIKTAVPGAEEVISYGMPAFKYHGMLAYFAAYKNHIGFYPMPLAIKTFKKELADYKTSKGTVQFPLDKPLPLGLISKMTKFRAKENLEKSKKKKTTKK